VCPRKRSKEFLSGLLADRARRVTFQMAEVAVPRSLITAILQRIGRLRVSPNPEGGAGLG